MYAANRGRDRRGSHISAGKGLQKRCRLTRATRIRIDWPAARFRRILPGKQEKMEKIALKAHGFQPGLSEMLPIPGLVAFVVDQVVELLPRLH